MQINEENKVGLLDPNTIIEHFLSIPKPVAGVTTVSYVIS